MPKGAQLYNFRIDLSDIDNNNYGLITYKSVLHPSETLERMVLRSILYAVFNYQQLEFTKGVCVADEPDLWSQNEDGKTGMWLEIGLPTNERLHKICRDSNQVVLILYGKAYNRYKCQKSIGNNHDNNLSLIYINDQFVTSVAANAIKNNHWSIIIQDNEITVIDGDDTFTTSLKALDRVSTS